MAETTLRTTDELLELATKWAKIAGDPRVSRMVLVHCKGNDDVLINLSYTSPGRPLPQQQPFRGTLDQVIEQAFAWIGEHS